MTPIPLASRISSFFIHKEPDGTETEVSLETQDSPSEQPEENFVHNEAKAGTGRNSSDS